jgi:hypothetical protein
MDKVHKPVTTQYYTQSSKPFRILLRIPCDKPLFILYKNIKLKVKMYKQTPNGDGLDRNM